MARGPKPVALSLTPLERETLQALVRRRSTHQDVAMRALIVLACADPRATNTAIAQQLGVSRQSVVTWRQRFLAHRLDGLSDAPRSDAPRRVGVMRSSTSLLWRWKRNRLTPRTGPPAAWLSTSR